VLLRFYIKNKDLYIINTYIKRNKAFNAFQYIAVFLVSAICT
jgi:hypothetical protein